MKANHVQYWRLNLCGSGKHPIEEQVGIFTGILHLLIFQVLANAPAHELTFIKQVVKHVSFSES